jgi:ketosteroid isomerase-like protein
MSFASLILFFAAAQADPKAALMDADRAFAKAAAEKRLDGWMSFMADDAARAPRIGAKITAGREAVRKLDAALFANPKVKLVWEPTDAHAFADGKSGVTTGRYRVLATGEDGRETESGTGAYVTWWRKETDGSWKVIFDTGTPDAAAKN